MSETSASYQCTYINPNESYQSSLLCRTSDLIQRYTGSVTAPQIPAEYDFTVLKPVLQILLMSANPAMSEATLKGAILPASVKWYVNDVLIQFDGQYKSTKPAGFAFDAGTFELILPNTDNSLPFGGLRFAKNLVTGLGGVNGVVKCEFSFVDNNGKMVTQQHTYPIGCRQFSSDGYELEVYTDGSMVLDSSNTSVLLRARLWNGATKEFDSKTQTSKMLRWYTYDATAGDWVVISASVTGEFSLNSSTRELTVLPDAVPTFLNVMAAVFPSGSTETDYRKAEATDISTVHDSTDPLFIQPNPTPADGVLRAGETTPDGVTLAPKVYDKDSGAEKTGFKFRFICMSPAGTIMNGTPASSPGASGGFDSNGNSVADNTELLTTYKVPRAMFEALGVGPTVLINAYLNT